MTELEHEAARILRSHVGKDAAIPYWELANILGRPDRTVRKIVRRLVTIFKVPIVSSYDKDCGGYYMPEAPEDIVACAAKLRKHGISILVRAHEMTGEPLSNFIGQLNLDLKTRIEG